MVIWRQWLIGDVTGQVNPRNLLTKFFIFYFLFDTEIIQIRVAQSLYPKSKIIAGKQLKCEQIYDEIFPDC